MPTKLFSRISYLLFLFQIPCFAASQTISSSSNNPTNRFIDELTCSEHPLKEKEKIPENKILIFGFIRRFNPEMEEKIIPDDIVNVCLTYYYFERFIPCDCKVSDFFERIRYYKPSKKDTFSGNFTIIISYLKLYAIENAKQDGYTAFIYAACWDKLEILKLLKKSGANVNAESEDGENALHAACQAGHSGIVSWLLDVCKLPLEYKSGGWRNMTPFFMAASQGHLTVLQLLKSRLNSNKDEKTGIYAEDNYNRNALYWACYTGDPQLVTWLIDKCGFDTETKGPNKETPFLVAAERGELPILKLLQKRGANINAKDKTGKTALDLARENYQYQVITYLESLDVKSSDDEMNKTSEGGNMPLEFIFRP